MHSDCRMYNINKRHLQVYMTQRNEENSVLVFHFIYSLEFLKQLQQLENTICLKTMKDDKQ